MVRHKITKFFSFILIFIPMTVGAFGEYEVVPEIEYDNAIKDILAGNPIPPKKEKRLVMSNVSYFNDKVLKLEVKDRLMVVKHVITNSKTQCRDRIMGFVIDDLSDEERYELLELAFDTCFLSLSDGWKVEFLDTAQSSRIPPSLLNKILRRQREYFDSPYQSGVHSLQRALYYGHLRHLNENQLELFLIDETNIFLVKEAIVFQESIIQEFSESERRTYLDQINRWRNNPNYVLRALSISGIYSFDKMAHEYLKNGLMDESPEVSAKAISKIIGIIVSKSQNSFWKNQTDQEILDLLTKTSVNNDVRVMSHMVYALYIWLRSFDKTPSKLCELRNHSNLLISFPARYYAQGATGLGDPETLTSCDKVQRSGFSSVYKNIFRRMASLNIISPNDSSDFMLRISHQCPSIHNTSACGINSVIVKGGQHNLVPISYSWYSSGPQAWLYHPDYMTHQLKGECNCYFPLFSRLNLSTISPILWRDYIDYWDQFMSQESLKSIKEEYILVPISDNYFEKIENKEFYNLHMSSEAKSRYQKNKQALKELVERQKQEKIYRW